MISNSERYARNAGFISAMNQSKLSKITIAVAGVGGVGGRVSTELVRMGITKLNLADPDIFTATNLNRQEGAAISTLGKRKVDVVADMCRDINPDVEIRIFSDGVSEENVDEFLDSSDILIEATDFLLPHLGVMLARSARAKNIPVVMGVEIGFGATLTWFKPDGFTYERYFGLNQNVTLEQLKTGNVVVNFRRFLPHVPSYGDLTVLEQVAKREIDAPAIAPAVSICAAVVSTHVLSMISGKSCLPAAPRVYHVDVKEHRSGIIRYPLFHHYLSLAIAMANNITGNYDRISPKI